MRYNLECLIHGLILAVLTEFEAIFGGMRCSVNMFKYDFGELQSHSACRFMTSVIKQTVGPYNPVYNIVWKKQYRYIKFLTHNYT